MASNPQMSQYRPRRVMKKLANIAAAGHHAEDWLRAEQELVRHYANSEVPTIHTH